MVKSGLIDEIIYLEKKIHKSTKLYVINWSCETLEYLDGKTFQNKSWKIKFH